MLSCCQLCGGRLARSLRLADGEAPWLGRVRAIYIENCSWFEATLSGVADWFSDTQPLLLPRECQNRLAFHEENNVQSGPYRWQVRIDQAYPTSSPFVHHQFRNTGFVFHESCWTLLQWSCYPNPVNVQTLNLFLRSFGMSPREHVVNWGHTYGDIYHGASDHEQFRDIFSYNTSFMNRRDGLDRRQFYDPLVDEPLLGEMVGRLKEKENARKYREDAPVARIHLQQLAQNSTCDIFGSLPAEILEFILIYLSSKDVRNGRLASQTLANVRLGQAFWRSRFSPGNEFDFVPEPWLVKHKVIDQSVLSDAQAVYNTVRRELDSGSLHFENRQRIWRVLQPLSEALGSFHLYEKEHGRVKPHGEGIASLWEPEIEEEDTRRWQCTHGELLNSYIQPFHFGCRPLFKRTVSLSSPCEAILVSVVPWHGVTYVTGLRFQLSGETEATLGYALPDRETRVSIGGRLRGFEVATGERGIHAIAPIASDGDAIWVGDKGKYRVKRLGSGGRVEAVKAYLDGMKMTYFGIPDYIHDPQGPFSIWPGARDT